MKSPAAKKTKKIKSALNHHFVNSIDLAPGNDTKLSKKEI